MDVLEGDGLRHDPSRTTAEGRDDLLRNLAWGILTAFSTALAVSTGVGLVALFSADTRAELAELGWRGLVMVPSVALACGAVLGLLRPLTDRPLGASFVGGCVAFVGVATQLAVLGEGGVFSSPGALGTLLIASFLVGGLFGPIWKAGVASGRIPMPDIDRFLGEVIHAPSDPDSDTDEAHTA